MNKRQLGKNGPEITEIGLGAWAIGGSWAWGWGEQEDTASLDTIAAALDAGINWIDTAPVYGLGHSEEVVGKAVKGRRHNVIVATKCGLRWDERRRITNNLHPASIRKECEDSLRRLQTDYIDLYQIHWPHKNIPVEESWGQMTRLVEEGKVRYIGVSNFNIDLLERCQAIQHIDSLQPPYSLVERKLETELLPWCRENETGIIVYSPLQSGLLTGKFSRDFLEDLPEDDWRKKNGNATFREPLFSAVLDFVDGLRPIAAGYEKTVAQLAIAWTLMQAGVSSAIVGARKTEQIKQNAGGADWQISDKDMEKIEQRYQETVGVVSQR